MVSCLAYQTLFFSASRREAVYLWIPDCSGLIGSKNLSYERIKEWMSQSESLTNPDFMQHKQSLSLISSHSATLLHCSLRKITASQ